MKVRSKHIVYGVVTLMLVSTVVFGLNSATLAGTLTPNAPPMPNEFAISTLTAFDGAVAFNSKHDEYLVVWSSNYNLYGHRVSSRGELVGNEFAIATHSDREYDLAIAYDATNDRYLVVWTREVPINPSTNYFYIYGRFIPWTGPDSNLAEFAVSTSTNDSGGTKVAYAHSQGEFLVVWHNWPLSGYHSVHGRRVKADMSGFPANTFTIASHISQERHNPDVTYNLEHNEYMVTYDNDNDIFGVIMAGDSTKLHGGEFAIAEWPGPELNSAVAACSSADDDHEYLVAWQSNNMLYARYVSDKGVEGYIFPAPLDGSTSSLTDGIDIACKWNLWYLVTWEHWYSAALGRGIWGAVVYADETKDANFEIVTPPDSSTQRINPVVAGGDPNYLVVWEHGDGTGYADIYGRIVGETKPKPDFTFSPSSGNTNTTFQFDASNSSDHEDATAVLQVCWDWDNNGTCETAWSTTKTADHKFSTDGTHTVQLKVKDTYGLTASTTKQVGVGNSPPTAAFTVDPSIGDSSTYFVFDPTGSTDNEDPTSALQLRWDWDNDGTWDTLWGAMQTSGVTFGAASYGQQTIVLEVEDTKGLRDSTTGTLMIDNKPTAAFKVNPPSGDTNTAFSFDASSSTDPDIGIYWLDARWDWEDDGTYDTSWNSILTLVTHSFPHAGTYTVRMELQPSIGGITDTTTRQVTVSAGTSNTAPTAAFTVSPTSGDTNTIFQFDASTSSDNEDLTSALQVRWDFDDDGVFEIPWGIGKTANYTYPAAGTYTVRLEVEDTGGLVDSVPRSVSVRMPGALIPIYLPLVGRGGP